MDTDFELCDGKSFKDLCKDIIDNQHSRKFQIEVLISELRPMIKTGNDAMMIVPLIKQYIDAGISNDEHLVKLAQICQRLITAQAQAEASGTSFGLSEEEKKELMTNINEIQKSDAVITKTISKKE
jgi:hypothetical protein